MTLEEKLEERLVVVEGNVRLGRYVEVGVGARLADCNIDDGVEIGEQARIRGSAVRDGARIGAGAVIEDSYVGTMSDVASTLARPTALVAGIALGDEVTVEAGTYLRGPLGIPPRTRVSKRF